MAGRGGRNDDAIAAALTAVAQALAHNQGSGGHEDQGEAEERRLDRFMRNKLPTFKGRFEIDLFKLKLFVEKIKA